MIDVVILFFMLGLLAGLARSELKLPAALYESLSLVLLLTIGLKGGEGLAKQAIGPLLPQLGLVILLGVVQTIIIFGILRVVGRLGRIDSASIAAHYGSVSVATFAVATNWLMLRQISFEPQLAIFLTVMEVPAIVVGILLARGLSRNTNWRALGHEAFLGKGVTLLVGGLGIGWIAGPEGLAPIKDLFFNLFKGALALFLLEMGLIVARQIGELRQRGLFIIAFGLFMPLISALLGLWCGLAMGLSVGGVTLLATLAASASYIAVPATMRLALPEASPALSLSAVLGITFPFNIIVGIPIYHLMAVYFSGAGS
jgi:uncharacterized protein